MKMQRTEVLDTVPDYTYIAHMSKKKLKYISACFNLLYTYHNCFIKYVVHMKRVLHSKELLITPH